MPSPNQAHLVSPGAEHQPHQPTDLAGPLNPKVAITTLTTNLQHTPSLIEARKHIIPPLLPTVDPIILPLAIRLP